MSWSLLGGFLLGDIQDCDGGVADHAENRRQGPGA